MRVSGPPAFRDNCLRLAQSPSADTAMPPGAAGIARSRATPPLGTAIADAVPQHRPSPESGLLPTVSKEFRP
jgi:hypothetical protein